MTKVERNDQGGAVVGTMLAAGIAVLAIWALIGAIVKAVAR